MSLTLVAIPIGHPDDLSFRALQTLQAADIIIGEERKVAAALLRRLEITGKPLELLNEHSSAEDVKELFEHCRQKSVALISDCGTPGFCDPGAKLIKACRSEGVLVTSIPGASSLMHLLSLSSEQLHRFFFRGFLPAESEARDLAWRELTRENQAIVLMDTPYRLKKFLTEIAKHMPQRKVLLGLNLTAADEEVIETIGGKLAESVQAQKAPFVALVYPIAGSAAGRPTSKKPTSGPVPHRKPGKKRPRSGGGASSRRR